MDTAVITYKTIRGSLAEHGVFGYRIAARLNINPVRFSQLINGRVRMTQDLALRIMEAIRQEAKEREELPM